MGSQNDLPSQNHMRTGGWHLHATPHATSMKEWSALTHLGLLFGAGSIAFLMLQREMEILLTCPPLKKRQASLLLKGWEENFNLVFNFLSLKAGGWQLFNGRQKGSFRISWVIPWHYKFMASTVWRPCVKFLVDMSILPSRILMPQVYVKAHLSCDVFFFLYQPLHRGPPEQGKNVLVICTTRHNFFRMLGLTTWQNLLCLAASQVSVAQSVTVANCLAWLRV